MSDHEAKLSGIAHVAALRKEGRHAEAFQALVRLAQREDNAVLQARYARILSTLDQGVFKAMTPIRVAVLASSTDKFLRDVLGFWLALAGFNAVFFEAAYDTIAQTILAPDSKLYAFDPDIVWIFTTFRDVQIPRQWGRSREETCEDVDEVIRGYSSLWGVLQERCRAYIIQNNADLPPYRTLGNYDSVASWSHSSILRRYNSRLTEALKDGVMIFDLEYISAFFGKEKWFEFTHWYNSKIPFSLDAVGEVAHQAARLIAAIKGQAQKCLVLDLDNTLWGGVIADDGLGGIALGDGPVGEAFVDFQRYILELKERGVILAVCSKNDEEKAREPFLKHPDMRLKLEDISVFKANWGNKADNIKDIAHQLNIGLDAIVFVDDNPAERELVARFLPQVVVPVMPDDPSRYRQTLDHGRYFETIGISAEDGKRTEYYRSNMARDSARQDSCDLAGYLQSLEMEASVGIVDDFHLPRVVQLINKSNQFHLTTTRYGESVVKELAGDQDVICRHFSLKDKFGDNGLIAVVILKRAGDLEYVVDTWCMSCRVLARGMEEYICRTMIDLGLERGIRRIIGVYIPTAKNGLVADLYPRLGFTPIAPVAGGTMRWQLDLDRLPGKYETYIGTSKT